jgi:hypothetical protein
MKKRISLLACVTFVLVSVAAYPQSTSAYPWPQEYGTCMNDSFSTWSDCYVDREVAIENCLGNPQCEDDARDAWWNCQGDSNSIFGNCVSLVDIDYFELDFCDNALSVYNDCFNTYQCEAIEDDDTRYSCFDARWICTSNSGIEPTCR